MIEFQRTGRNKDTTINQTYISSGKFRNKFDKIHFEKVQSEARSLPIFCDKKYKI